MKKHLFFWASLLVAGLALTACGGDDADDFSDKTTPVAPTGKQKWTVTVGAGVMTRGLNDDLSPKWSADDEVYVYHGRTKVGTLKPTAFDKGSVTLTGELENSDYSTESGYNTLNLSYKYEYFDDPDYSGQDGTIEDIAENFDFLRATVTITAVNTSTRTLTVSTANFETLQSIMCLTFTEPLLDGDWIGIWGGEFDAEVYPTGPVAEGTPIYVAVPFSSTPSSYELQFYIANSSSGDEVYLVNDWPTKSLQNGKQYTATVKIEGVRLWKKGPFWATKNLGASSKTDSGDYFAWGDIKGYSSTSGHEFTLANYKYYDSVNGVYTKYTSDGADLLAEDDAAVQILGDRWHIPLSPEFFTLIENTEQSDATVNGVKGKLFSAKSGSAYSGRSIFMPYAGAMFSSGLSGFGTEGQYLLRNGYGTTQITEIEIRDNWCSTGDEYPRYDGKPIRPLKD